MKAASLAQRLQTRTVTAFALLIAAASVLILVPVTSGQAQQPGSRQLAQGPPVKEWPGKAKRWALVIGVDQYRDGNISALRGAANDAGALARALTQYAGFPSDQVILLATDQPEERQPTRINILAYLSNISAAVPKDGLLLVSFAGHGLERGGQAYLIPSDARLTDDVSLLEESAVSVQRMHDRIRSTGVGQVVVLLDACRNDPGGRADAANNLTPAYTKAFDFDVRNREVQAYATIYATAVGKRAFEYVEKKQGYFSWALVEGLKGAAANERGEVTLAALVKYVQDAVPKRVAIDLGAGKEQRPFANIEGYLAADLVIAVGQPPGVVSNNPPPKETRIDAAAVEQEHWEAIRRSNDVQAYKDYLQAYPNGAYAGVARVKISQIEAAKNPEPVRPQPTSPTKPGKADSDTALQLFIKGGQLVAQKNLSSAEAQYREAVRLDPTDSRYRIELGSVIFDQGRFSEAESEYRIALQLAPDNALLHAFMGDCLRKEQKQAESDAEYLTAIRLDPNNAQVRIRYGNSFYNQKKYEEAAGQYRRAAQLNPDNAMMHAFLADALFYLGKYREAEAEYKAALNLDPKNEAYKKSLKLAQDQK